jgi:hypothetical protein
VVASSSIAVWKPSFSTMASGAITMRASGGWPSSAAHPPAATTNAANLAKTAQPGRQRCMAPWYHARSWVPKLGVRARAR